MAPTPTARDVCRHCGNEWRPGWERCRRCGAKLRNRITAPVTAAEVTDASGLELDRRARQHPRQTTTARVARVDASEAPTRELSAETAPPRDPATLISLTQLLTGALGLLLLAQLLFPAALPSLTALTVLAIRGGRVGALPWLLAAVPWFLTAGVLGLALAASRSVTGPSRKPAPALSALLAVLPGVLLVGWPALHEHLVSALVRRGGRKPGALLTGWSRAVLGCLSAEVLLTFLHGLGVLALPPAAVAAVAALAFGARQGHLCALVITLPVLLLQPGRAATPLPSQLLCPQCGEDAPTLQRFRDGLAGSACARCAGALLGPGQVSTLLSMAQVEDATYRREIRLGSTGTRPLHCPQCGSAMRGVQLRTVTANGCPACGSLWLDRLGLARLAGGRPVLSTARVRLPASPGRVWPVLAATLTLVVAAMPWVAVRAGWCRPEVGACASVSAIRE
ncbi:MAG TPA: zf-TFIIB domain-containing protein [Myxococcaceae bacterium]|nr:zf-TFIIB domain-containing protein [Myxococcaceae bacterium]